MIPVLVATQVNTVTHGDGHLTGLILKDHTSGATETVLATALFILIGAEPHTDWLPERIWRDGGVHGHRQ